MQLFEQHGGYLNSRQVRAAGIPLKSVQRLATGGQVEVVQRGVYHLPNSGVPAHADLIELQLRLPYARPTLVTALDLHCLTTTKPAAVQLAVPLNRSVPELAWPPLQVFWYPPEIYEAGLIRWDEGGASFISYSPEKTLADLLRLERRLGRDVYIEGLKRYLAAPVINIPELLEMARVCGVQRTLRRDLEVLTHEANH